jgi:Flp pilus assembly protein protease CpaA
MSLTIILTTITLIALIIASYTDLKTREVPDWISYGLIFSGLGIRLMFSLENFEWIILLKGIAGFLTFVAIAYLMYYTGQWGGGDSKLLMGLGAIMGLDFQITPLPTLAVFFITLLIAGAFYGVLWMVFLAITHPKEVSLHFNRLTKQAKLFRNVTLIATGTLAVALLIIVKNVLIKSSLLIFILLPITLFYLLTFVKAVERAALYKRIHPKHLTEGDWLGETINVKKKQIAGPKDLGITKQQIKKLITLYKQKKIKKVLVRNGIPFVPSFLIAFVITLILQNKFF